MKKLVLIIFIIGFQQSASACDWMIFNSLCEAIFDDDDNNGEGSGAGAKKEPVRKERTPDERPPIGISFTEAKPPCVDCRAEAPFRVKAGPEKIPTCGLGVGINKVNAIYYRTCNVPAVDEFPRDRSLCTDHPDFETCSAEKLKESGVTSMGQLDYVMRRTPRDEFWLRKIQNPNMSDVYQPGSCTQTVNGIDYGKLPKIFAYAGGLGVTFEGGRAVVDAAYCGTKVQFGVNGSYCGIEKGSVPAAGIECFKYAHLGMMASCMKLSPDEEIVKDRSGELRVKIGGEELIPFTGLGLKLSRREDSCLTQPKLDLKQGKTGADTHWPLMSGDMIVENTPGGAAHTLVVTNMRPDPLGIQKILTSGGKCSDVSLSGFNFDVSQSTGYESAGPIHTSIRAYDQFDRVRAPLGMLLTLAKKICAEAKKSNGKKSTRDILAGADNFGLIRHKSVTEGPGSNCTYPANKCPKILGDDCGKQCFGDNGPYCRGA